MHPHRLASALLLAGGLLAPAAAGPMAARLPASLAPAPRSTPGPDALRRAGAYDREDVLSSFARAHHPATSGQLVYSQRPGVVFTDRGVPFNHGSPWEYDTRVPLVFYGPGQVRPGPVRGERGQPYHVMPTLAAAFGVEPSPDFRARAWTEVLEARRERPRAALVVVMDQVGYQDVVRFQDWMPTLRRFRREGAEFTDARLDYLPSVTAVSHAGVGTGAPPAFHGVSNNFVPYEDGRPGLNVIFRRPGQRVEPSMLKVRSFADWLDQRFQNRSVILSQVYAEYAATGMAGHGKGIPGGDADVVLWYDDTRGTHTTDPRWFRKPSYLNGRSVDGILERFGPTLAAKERVAALIAAKGPAMAYKTVKTAPWFAQYEANQMLELMVREKVGRDDVPDLVMVNLKTTDAFGHQFGHEHPGYRAALRQVDRFLLAAEELLRRRAGEGRYVIAVTADHGLAPDDAATRANEALAEWLGAALDHLGDRDGVSSIHDVDGLHVHVRMDELREEGHSLETVRRLLLEDGDILDAWTADEVRARQAEILPELAGRR